MCGLDELQRTSEDLGLANFKPQRIFAGRYINNVLSKFLRRDVGFIFMSLVSRVGAGHTGVTRIWLSVWMNS